MNRTAQIAERIACILLAGVERFAYPKAKSAPAHLSKLIATFHAKSEDFKKTTTLLEFLIGPRTWVYKMSAADSQYTDFSQAHERCANCDSFYTHYASGKSLCSRIETRDVQPTGWCRLWAKAGLGPVRTR